MQFVLCLFLLPVVTAYSQTDYKIVTASERGTYIQIGRDLAKWVAPPAMINLEVLPSNGSAENVKRLRYEAGVKLALVQSDVYQAFVDQAAAGNAAAGTLINPLRVVLPLYDEEIYFVTRADSPLTYIHELKGKKINVGPVGSGTALSATTLYRLMFSTPLPESDASYLSNEEALLKLTNDKTLDAVVIVAGQPAKLFSEMAPEARQYIKLLRRDDKAPEIARAVTTYYPANIRSKSYPSWMTEDVPTLSVKAFLVTYNYGKESTQSSLKMFAESLCANFDQLQTQGHPKWLEVQLQMPVLGKGWKYYPTMERVLRSCIANKSRPSQATSPSPVIRNCSQQEKVLGLCRM
ncbi:TAXI family TRAP transporter solute-binding subunit [Noviherbaspirillum saxi]|uniref:TAXI family TRAP transporter solute-binding subunit n=1 Tax=Noviherbaspirillum saxi TaxID=2320863 RepID=UPI001F28B898|nr:TAXI family TRAP transporter solute-binding subunit [Noviherbaspirillum saxi]